MDGIELMASAMHAARTRLDIAASNLANVSTDGFQRRLAHARLTSRGIEISSAADSSQGALRHTDRTFDLAAVGGSGLRVRTPQGEVVWARSGSFERDANGHWSDAHGRMLLDENGPLRASADARIDQSGGLWENGAQTARLAHDLGGTVQSGFLVAPNVDAVREMVDVLAAQRAFETAQKALSAIDDVRSKDSSDVARVKA